MVWDGFPSLVLAQKMLYQGNLRFIEQLYLRIHTEIDTRIFN